MSVSLRNKIAALKLKRDHEFAAKNEEILSLELKRDQDFSQMNKEISKLELEAELASVFPPPRAIIPSEVAVFATVARHDIDKKRVSKADFENMVACSYQLAVNCAEPFRTKSEEDFKNQMKATKKIDMNELVGGSGAKKVYDFMKNGTENIGKLIIVAYDKGIDGGGELRKITGPYRYSPIMGRIDRPSGFYHHQFPTEFVRKLTPKEFEKVAASRPPFAITWTARNVQ